MAGRRRAPAATSSYLPPVMTALLFLWVFSCGHVEASIEFANMTALEKHVEFFDRNKDGVITASELFEGYIAIGCDAAFASSSAASISAGVGPITSPSNSNRQSADHRKKRRRARRKTARGEGARAGNTVREYGVFTDAKPREADAPLPHSTIYIEYIHNAMHGSDTGAYDGKGRFVPAKFEEIFTKHAKVRPDALTYEEIEEMILANRDPLDPSSWSAPEGEWGLIYKLASDKQGFFHKDSARGIYDGSVFYKLEEQRTSARSDM